MRYLPLDADDRAAMLAASASPTSTPCSPTFPRDKRLDGLLDLPRAKSEIEVERALGGVAARNVAAGSVPFFSAPAPIATTCRRASTT